MATSGKAQRTNPLRYGTAGESKQMEHIKGTKGFETFWLN